MTGSLQTVSFAQIVSPEIIFGRYRAFTWIDQNQSGPALLVDREMLQTPDGYLWLNTEELVRFDGVNFTLFGANAPKDSPGVPRYLITPPTGDISLVTKRPDLKQQEDARVYPLPVSGPYKAPGLLVDRLGNYWVRQGGTGLRRFRNGKTSFYNHGSGLPSDDVRALEEDRDGVLWVGTVAGLARIQAGKIESFRERDGLSQDFVSALHSDRTGRLWIGHGDGTLSVYSEGRFHPFAQNSQLPKSQVVSIFQDRERRLWIGYAYLGGLVLVENGRVQRALASNQIQEILEDQDNNIWVAALGTGLIELREVPVRVFGNSSTAAVIQTHDGGILAGTNNQIVQVKNDRLIAPAWGRNVNDNSLTEDPFGSVWLSIDGGIAQVWNGRRIEFPLPVTRHYRNRIFADRTGAVWIGNYAGYLARCRNGIITPFTSKDGWTGLTGVGGFSEDPRTGAILIATLQGLARFQNGKFDYFSTRDGLSSNRVLCTFHDHSGSLWIGTQGGGLNRFKNGRFSSISTENGLFDNLAFTILEDGEQNLWMSCNRGIYRASLHALNAVADGVSHTLESYSYGKLDGMLDSECNGAIPAGCRARDGKLWFSNAKGLVSIDPRLAHVGHPAHVIIEQVNVDGAPFSADRPIRVEVGKESLEIKYTAISWDRPSQIRFKVKMDGVDNGWVQVGTRRSLLYAHLGPGDYRFHVTADNGNGLWSVQDRSVAITVVSPFYRSWWFFCLCALAIAALVTLAWKFRVAQLAKAQAAQQAFSRQLIRSQERERQRIASELHDSLGQRLVLIKNLALLSLKSPEKEGSLFSRIQEISAEASEANREIRDISYNLRPYQLDRIGLTKAVQSLTAAVNKTGAVQVTADIDNIDGSIPKELEINFYRIVQEALNNIVKHSGASEAKVSVRRRPAMVSLLIQDNGNGGTAASATGFGLIGMSERGQSLGGKIGIQGLPGAGTTITLEVPIN